MLGFVEEHLPAKNRTVELTLKYEVDFRVCTPNEAMRRTEPDEQTEREKVTKCVNEETTMDHHSSYTL
jgi:hypothetical protein